MTRWRPLAATVAALTTAALLAAGCSTGPSESSATDPAGGAGQTGAATPVEDGAYPVTVEHAYGETTITAEPQRVVTVGWTDADVAAALGVAPIGAPEITWGGNADLSTPWFDAAIEKLGAEPPTRYSEADGLPIDDIARLEPDLILATQSGLTRAEYDKLSSQFKVVAPPGEVWLTSWQDSLRMVGQALGRPQAAAELTTQTQAVIDGVAQQHPAVVDKSFVFAWLNAADTSKIDWYGAEDNRVKLLGEMGLVNAPIIDKLSAGIDGGFYGTISAERAADLEADLFITYAEDEAEVEKLRADPLLKQIPAFSTGGLVAATDKTDSLGLSSPSPLSIPYAVEHFVPTLAAAAEAVDSAS